MKWVLIAVAVLIGVVAAVALVGALLPKGHVASRSSRFKQPPQAVWEVIIGPPNWRPDVTGFEQLPAREGRRSWKETGRHGQAITYEMGEEIPPRRLVTRMTDPKLPFGGSWIFEITPNAEGCELKITEEAKSTIQSSASWRDSSSATAEASMRI